MDADAQQRSRRFDAITSLVGVIGIFILVAEAALLDRFKRMFDDFGGTLPVPTEFVLRTRLPLSALLVSVALISLGSLLVLRSKDSRPAGRALLLAASVVSWTLALLAAASAALPLRTLGLDRIF